MKVLISISSDPLAPLKERIKKAEETVRKMREQRSKDSKKPWRSKQPINTAIHAKMEAIKELKKKLTSKPPAKKAAPTRQETKNKNHIAKVKREKKEKEGLKRKLKKGKSEHELNNHDHARAKHHKLI